MVLAFSLFMVVIVTLMSIISYSFQTTALVNRAVADTEVILAQAANNIGRYISNTTDIADIIKNSPDLIDYLEGGSASTRLDYKNNPLQTRKQEELKKRIGNFINAIPDVKNGIINIFIFDNNNQTAYLPQNLKIKNNFDITKEKWYKDINEDTNAPLLLPTYVRRFTEKSNPWVLSLSSKIKSPNTQLNTGTMLVELNFKIIDEICSQINLGARGYVFVVDNNGSIVYHPQLQLIYSGLKEENIKGILETDTSVLLNDDRVYNINNITNTGFKIIGVTYLDEVMNSYYDVNLIYILIALGMVLLAVVGSTQLAKLITRPITKLEVAVNEVEKGNLNVQFEVSGTIEVEKFAASLNAMIIKVKELMSRIVKDQETIRTSELKALQSQINPHFLYNTLDSIIWIAEDSKNAKIKQITVALANYFRIVLSNGDDIITVQTEVEHIRNYLVIQKMRYEQYLDYIIDIDPALHGLYMPKLLLQPIVENAIYHGIKNLHHQGLIKIKGIKTEDKMVFVVEDNGRGMKAPELERVFSVRKNPLKRGGVGLNNVKERIKLYYGESYGIKIESVFKEGTKVYVYLPLEVKNDTKENN